MGRTWIHAFKAVLSTYHMVLKFLTRNGVGEAKGDQKMARSCYVAALRPDGTGVSDVFAWIIANIPGIDPNLITHRLNVDPTRKVVKQKKRTYAPDRLEAIKHEVKKLLEAGFIEEVQFPEWLANPNAGDTYQRLLNKIFIHLTGKIMEVYIDDMLVKILSKADHISRIGEAFEVLRHHKMMLNPTKCAFGVGYEIFFGSHGL
ncbi:uncharacterized protein LOC141687804 [Apium graveolens]|uniref:uncharacterized protein LOC141687804 n=1 Tax=Apium graveolens TaxID=4045 RepID=UPI003D7B3590